MPGYQIQNDGSIALNPTSPTNVDAAGYSSVVASRLKRVLTSVPDFAVSFAGDIADVVGAAVLGKKDAGQTFYNAYSLAGLTNEAHSAAEKIAAAYHSSQGTMGLENIAALTRQYAGGRNPVRRAIAQELVDQGVVGHVSEVYTHEKGAKTATIGGQEFVKGYYDTGDRFGSLMKNMSSELWTGLIVGGAATAGAGAVGSYLAKRAVVDSAFGAASKNITDHQYFGGDSQAVSRALERTGKLAAYSPTFGLIGMGAEALARVGKNIGKGDSRAAKAIGAATEYAAFGAELAMAASLVDTIAGSAGHQYLGETSIGKHVAKASNAVDSVPRYAMSGVGNAIDNLIFSTAYAQTTDAPSAKPSDPAPADKPAQNLVKDTHSKDITITKDMLEKASPIAKKGFEAEGYKVDQPYALGKAAPTHLDAGNWTSFLGLGAVAKDGVVTQKEFDGLATLTQKGFEAAGLKIGTEYVQHKAEPSHLAADKWVGFTSLGKAAKDGVVSQKEFDALDTITQSGFKALGFEVGKHYAAEKAEPAYLKSDQWAQFSSLGAAKDGVVTKAEYDKLNPIERTGFDSLGFKSDVRYAQEKTRCRR